MFLSQTYFLLLLICATESSLFFLESLLLQE